jgi:hypothetical protein
MANRPVAHLLDAVAKRKMNDVLGPCARSCPFSESSNFPVQVDTIGRIENWSKRVNEWRGDVTTM